MTSVALAHVQFGKRNWTTDTISRRKIVIFQCIFLCISASSCCLCATTRAVIYPLFVWNTLHWIMSSNNLSQGGAKRLKGTSKENEDKELSGKDEKTKEEIKKEEPKDVNYKGPVLEPLYKPFPSIIEFLYNGKNEVLTPEAGAVDDFYVQMIDERCRAMKASLYKKIYESLKEVMTDEEKKTFNIQRKCGFSSVHKHLAELRKEMKQGEAEPLPEGVNVKEEAVKTFPSSIEFSYNGDDKVLEPKDEVVAKFFTSVLDHKYIPEENFNTLIFSHLQKAMTDEEKKKFEYPNMFDFSHLLGYFREQADLRKEMTEGEREWMKYETASKLKKRLKKIRDAYKEDWVDEDLRIKQRGVALYLIDKLALRVGNHAPPSKDNYIAGTVGCCSLRVQHIKLTDEKEKGFWIEFNFPGKNSQQFERKLRVKDIVFKKIQQICKEAKEQKHELFHLVKPRQLNTYLQKLMPGLTTKVFRTCHASILLQEKLEDLTAAAGDSLPSKLQAYKQAIEAAAVLCNHKRAASKTSDKQMANQQDKIKKMETELEKTKGELKSVRDEKKQSKNKNKKMKQLDKRESELENKQKDQVAKLKEAKNAKKSYDSNVTTTINYYLDPRIIVAWCKKWEVPVEEVYNRTQRDKFRWAIDMAEDLLDYVF